MASTETLRDTLVALQADLCIQGALTAANQIKATLSSPIRPLPTSHQVAVDLMSKMMARDGTPIQWRIPRPGQKYPLIIRATRVILEHILRKKVVLEGTPRGNEVKVDIQGAAADLVARQGGITSTQSSTQSDSQPSTYPDTDTQTTPKSKGYSSSVEVTPIHRRRLGQPDRSLSPLARPSRRADMQEH